MPEIITRAIKSEQGLLTGEAHLLPAQKDFLEAASKIDFDYNAYLSAFFIKVTKLDESIFKQSFTKLL
jgi:hypothetical protein